MAEAEMVCNQASDECEASLETEDYLEATFSEKNIIGYVR